MIKRINIFLIIFTMLFTMLPSGMYVDNSYAEEAEYELNFSVEEDTREISPGDKVTFVFTATKDIKLEFGSIALDTRLNKAPPEYRPLFDNKNPNYEVILPEGVTTPDGVPIELKVIDKRLSRLFIPMTGNLKKGESIKVVTTIRDFYKDGDKTAIAIFGGSLKCQPGAKVEFNIVSKNKDAYEKDNLNVVLDRNGLIKGKHISKSDGNGVFTIEPDQTIENLDKDEIPDVAKIWMEKSAVESGKEPEEYVIYNGDDNTGTYEFYDSENKKIDIAGFCEQEKITEGEYNLYLDFEFRIFWDDSIEGQTIKIIRDRDNKLLSNGDFIYPGDEITAHVDVDSSNCMPWFDVEFALEKGIYKKTDKIKIIDNIRENYYFISDVKPLPPIILVDGIPIDDDTVVTTNSKISFKCLTKNGNDKIEIYYGGTYPSKVRPELGGKLYTEPFTLAEGEHYIRATSWCEGMFHKENHILFGSDLTERKVNVLDPARRYNISVSEDTPYKELLAYTKQAKAGEEVVIKIPKGYQLKENGEFYYTLPGSTEKHMLEFSGPNIGGESFEMPASDVEFHIEIEKGLFELMWKSPEKADCTVISVTDEDGTERLKEPVKLTNEKTIKVQYKDTVKFKLNTDSSEIIYAIRQNGYSIFPDKDGIYSYQVDDVLDWYKANLTEKLYLGSRYYQPEKEGNGQFTVSYETIYEKNEDREWLNRTGGTDKVKFSFKAQPEKGSRILGIYISNNNGKDWEEYPIYSKDIKEDGSVEGSVVKGMVSHRSYQYEPYTNHDNISNVDTHDIDASEIQHEYKLKAVFTSLPENGEYYTISNESELREFAASVNAGDPYAGQTVKLTDDITLKEEWIPIGSFGGEKLIKHGIPEKYFAGIFDGCDHSIKGLEINRTYGEGQEGTKVDGYFGLFGKTDHAVIKNVNVSGKIAIKEPDNPPASSGYIYAAGIVGQAWRSDIQNCISSVDITLTSNAHDSYDSVDKQKIDLSGYGMVAGGIAGEFAQKSNEIKKCMNYGNITTDTGDLRSSFIIGGIAGKVGGSLDNDHLISDCGNYGNITTIAGIEKNIDKFSPSVVKIMELTPTTAGGIVGSMSAAYILQENRVDVTVKNCVNKGDIKGKLSAGGGICGVPDACNLIIRDCYNTGSVITDRKIRDANDYKNYMSTVGGLMGNTWGPYYYLKNEISFVNSYNAGNVKSEYPDESYTYVDPICNEHYFLDRGNNIEKRENKATLENTYSSAESAENITLEKLNVNNAYKEDVNNINGGFPLLSWEAAKKDTAKRDVTFNITPSNASLVLKDAEGNKVSPSGKNRYSLVQGFYSYTVTAKGYETVEGSVNVRISPITQNVNLRKISEVTFSIPKGADFVLSDGQKNIAPDEEGGSVYTLYDGYKYSYTVTAPGKNSISREFVADGNKTIEITLTDSHWSGGNKRITPGDHYNITSGGNYNLDSGDYNPENGAYFINVNTKEPVTIIGKGYAESSKCENVYIRCTEGTDITLQDVYISNTNANGNCKGNMIDFQGKGNSLKFGGMNILEQDTNASGFAMIHAPKGTELSITGSAYLYKREQGAGIGGNGGADAGKGASGQSVEQNGDITITDADIFIKSSKQGAGIGAGANASALNQTPGVISIEDSSINMIANSRGAGIGGSAGSDGASPGGEFHVDGSTVNINIDYSGAAIGGGGFAEGNDSDGGTLYCSNSSIRAFLDQNAVELWNVKAPGVNGNKAVTAKAVNEKGESLYLAAVDTSGSKGSTVTVKEGETEIYSGGLHEWGYYNENAEKGQQVQLNKTVDNWVRVNEPVIYLYLTGEDHNLNVNGKNVNLKWNEENRTFTVPSSQGGGIIQEEIPETELVPEITADENGNAKAVITDAEAEELVKKAQAEKSGSIAVKPVIRGNASKISVELPKNAADAIVKGGNFDLTLKTAIGDITLDGKDLKNIAASSTGKIELSVEKAKSSNGKVSLAVTADGKPVAKFSEKIRVSVPADSAGAGNVLVLIGPDGSEKAIRKSVMNGKRAEAALDGPGTVAVKNRTLKFNDTEKHWAKDAVDFVSSHELFNGTGENIFAPDDKMSRAMLATVLYRLEDESGVSAGNIFNDVENGQWYTDAVIWANQKGIVKGYDEKSFGTDDPVTREQLAAMMFRYAQSVGMDTSVRKDMSEFSDSGKVSPWAQDAVKWAVSNGILNGKGNNTLDPSGNATRAEVAAILQRIVKLMVR